MAEDTSHENSNSNTKVDTGEKKNKRKEITPLSDSDEDIDAPEVKKQHLYDVFLRVDPKTRQYKQSYIIDRGPGIRVVREQLGVFARYC